MRYKEPEQVPVGTAVVTLRAREDSSGYTWKQGAAATIVRAPAEIRGKYLLEMLTGAQVEYERDDFVLQRLHIPLSLQVAKEDFDPTPYLVLLTGVGSTAHGLATEGSDLDLKGVYVLPFELLGGLFSYPTEKDAHLAKVGAEGPTPYVPGHSLTEHLGPGSDNTFFEVGKFVTLALKADPNALEMLWSPIAEALTPSGEWLREARSLFVTRKIEHTFSNYSRQQFRRLRNKLESQNRYEPRHATNLVRLLISANHFVRTGEPLLDMSAHREMLLGIKSGEIPFAEVEKVADRLVDEFNEAVHESSLPEMPDLEAANRLVVRIRFAESGMP